MNLFIVSKVSALPYERKDNHNSLFVCAKRDGVKH